MDDQTKQNYIAAGKIASEVLAFGADMIKQGRSALATLQSIEQKIIERGGGMAFPPQISLNNCAAHSCPNNDDKTIFASDVVKLDVGVHINGCIADNALTIDLTGKHAKLIQASQKALDSVAHLFTPGTPVKEIGRVIQETIVLEGFKPVHNLSGHALLPFTVHAEPKIPNIPSGSAVLQKGMVVACEPFASAGEGFVREQGTAGVFQLMKKYPVRDQYVAKVLHKMYSYKGLPFALRWLTQEFGEAITLRAVHLLERNGVLHGYPPLVDTDLVSQAEYTFIVDEKPINITPRVRRNA